MKQTECCCCYAKAMLMRSIHWNNAPSTSYFGWSPSYDGSS